MPPTAIPWSLSRRRAGIPLVDADRVRSGRTRIGDRWATEAQIRDYGQAWSRFEEAADGIAGADRSRTRRSPTSRTGCTQTRGR